MAIERVFEYHGVREVDMGDRGTATLTDDVRRLRAEVATLSRRLAPDAAWRSTDADVLSAVVELSALRGAVDALHLRLVREVDTRGTAEASPVATTPEGFLRTSCLLPAPQARRDVAAARATAPGQPLERLGESLAEGACSRAHVDIAVRCVDRIPRHLLARRGAGDVIADYLLTAALGASPKDMDRAVRDLLQTLAPDPADRVDPAAYERRFFDLSTDATGMVVGRFAVDAVTGAELRATLERWSGPVSGGEAAATSSHEAARDRRTATERRADAFAFAIRTAAAVAAPRRSERPRVVVHVTPEQLAATGSAADGVPWLESGGPVPTWAARRLSCDAVLQRVVVSSELGPLSVGREERLANRAQRVALAARDGGCVIPGCGATPDVCDAHHVVHWVDGGPTDVDNMCLLCPGHHTAVHAGTWGVAIDPVTQLVSVTPPPWVDAARRPRPAWRQRARTTWARFQQDLQEPPEPPEPPEPSGPPGRPDDRLDAFDVALARGEVDRRGPPS